MNSTATAAAFFGLRVGVVAALPAEGRCLSPQRLRPGNSHSLSESLQLQLSGVGPERARQAAENLLATGAQALVSWGVAGGLAPHLKAGTLLLPKQVQAAKATAFPTDREWRQRLIHHLNGGLPLSCVALHHTETILSSAEAKAQLHEQTGCEAVDMESAAVGQVAAQAGVPFLIIRAVADPAQTTLPPSALRALNPEGRPQPLALARSLLRQPQDLFGLWQLAGYFHAARTTLRVFFAQVGPTLLAPEEKDQRTEQCARLS